MTIHQRQVLGDRLRARRREYGLTQRELAEVADVGYSQVYMLENARIPRPSLPVVLALAGPEALDVSLDWLCGRERYLLDAQIWAHQQRMEG